jgi:ABC-type multidrug transport system fused ATPase/permease subunit
LRQFFILSSRNLKILTRDRFSLFLMLAIAPLIAMLDIVFLIALGGSPFDYVDGSFVDVAITLFVFAIYGIMVGALSQMREIVKDGPVYKRERLVNLKIFPYVMSKLWVAVLLAIYHTTAFVVVRYLVFDMPGGVQELVIIFITMFLATIAGMMLGLFASAFAPNPNSAPLMAILLILPQMVLGGALIPLPHSITALISSRWAFEAFVSTTGAGSDVAADVCWSLPQELRDFMSLEDKEFYGCRCMGENVLNQETCDYPGLGSLYDPVIEQDAPVEPASIGDSPPEPIFPEPPEEPTNQSDESAVSQYVDDLGTYQDTIDQIQEDYKAQVDAYQIELDAYLDRMVNYQEEFATWQIDRNSAIARAEGTIKAIHEDMGWAFVDKENQEIYWSKITRTWIAQIAIITTFFIAILILMKRKDKVK